jgi:hypothetical protein
MMYKLLYLTALGSVERTQAFVSASIEFKNRLLQSKPHEVVVIVASMEKKKTLMERAISIARWELSNLTKSGAPQVRQRAAVHAPPWADKCHIYIMVFSCFASSPSRNITSKELL